MKSAIKEKVLKIFQQHRQNPNLSFEEEYFLDFLFAKKIKQGSIRNSFRGLALYNRFMEAIQLEFGVCFRLADKQKNYSLDELVEQVEQSLGNPKSSKAAMRYLLRQPFEWKLILFLNVFLGLITASSYRLTFVFIFFLILWIGVNGILINIYYRDKGFAKKLAEKVLGE
ncbi:MAG: hypothetical protein R8P61_06005 [Bacteroidia bacterium]|nr:hypothetical protein [Bacteroidia bacterium]